MQAQDWPGRTNSTGHLQLRRVYLSSLAVIVTVWAIAQRPVILAGNSESLPARWKPTLRGQGAERSVAN